MDYENLPIINRNAIFIEPTTAFLEWAREFKDRSFKAFKKFFIVHFSSVVVDLGRGSIYRD